MEEYPSLPNQDPNNKNNPNKPLLDGEKGILQKNMYNLNSKLL